VHCLFYAMFCFHSGALNHLFADSVNVIISAGAKELEAPQIQM